MEQDELLFFDGRPNALAVYADVRERFLNRHPETTVKVRKTQIGIGAPLLCVIAWLPRRKRDGDALMLSLCLPRPLESDRVQMRVEPYPGRYMHHLLLTSTGEIDAELLDWMEEAAAFARR